MTNLKAVAQYNKSESLQENKLNWNSSTNVFSNSVVPCHGYCYSGNRNVRLQLTFPINNGFESSKIIIKVGISFF